MTWQGPYHISFTTAVSPSSSPVSLLPPVTILAPLCSARLVSDRSPQGVGNGETRSRVRSGEPWKWIIGCGPRVREMKGMWWGRNRTLRFSLHTRRRRERGKCNEPSATRSFQSPSEVRWAVGLEFPAFGPRRHLTAPTVRRQGGPPHERRMSKGGGWDQGRKLPGMEISGRKSPYHCLILRVRAAGGCEPKESRKWRSKEPPRLRLGGSSLHSTSFRSVRIRRTEGTRMWNGTGPYGYEWEKRVNAVRPLILLTSSVSLILYVHSDPDCKEVRRMRKRDRREDMDFIIAFSSYFLLNIILFRK